MDECKIKTPKHPLCFADQETSPVKTLVQDATDMACGAEFTVWLTKKGIW
jgi:hypothetical protein